MAGRSLVALVAVLLVAGITFGLPFAAATSHPGPTPAPSREGWINISAVGQYGYSPPSLSQVPTDATITVTFTDQSQMAHTFTIIGKEGWVVPASYGTDQINQLAYGHSPSALENANVSSYGAVNVTTFLSPGPGWYEFLCTVSGHFQLGMYGFIAFGMNLPANLTTQNRTGIGGGLTLTEEDGILIGIIGVVAILAIVALNRRGSRRRLPP